MKSNRNLLRLLPVASALAASLATAGTLQDIYNQSTSAAAPGAADWNLKAADQNVQTQRMRYLPKLSLIARELWVYQDIRQSGTTVFQNGHDSYDSTRLNVIVDQPIYDPTIAPLVEASKARKRQAEILGRDAHEAQTRQLVEGFVDTARFQALIASCDRVIARLEKELDSVSKSHDAKIATVTDVQNIRLALAAVKRERNNFNDRLAYSLGLLGDSAERLKTPGVRLSPDADPASISAGASASARTPAAELVTAEAAEIGHQATATQRRSLPVLSLYSQWGLDSAGGSEFGGARDLSNYEVGLAVRWDIFDRGMNYSEARELKYRQHAKEAELRALAATSGRTDQRGRQLVEQAASAEADLADLVKQHEILRDASARAYDAGKESYLNSINAYLSYESTLREWVNARHDRVQSQAASQARASGWDSALVQKVDALFVAAN